MEQNSSKKSSKYMTLKRLFYCLKRLQFWPKKISNLDQICTLYSILRKAISTVHNKGKCTVTSSILGNVHCFTFAYACLLQAAILSLKKKIV